MTDYNEADRRKFTIHSRDDSFGTIQLFMQCPFCNRTFGASLMRMSVKPAVCPSCGAHHFRSGYAKQVIEKASGDEL